MGLDGVELILAIEEAFQIHVSDEEVGDIADVGQLYNLVVGKLDAEDSNKCLTSAAFYRTRRAIVETLGIDRGKVRPSTPLEAILPRHLRREMWHRLQTAMKLDLPPLRHPGWIQLCILTTGVALAVAPGMYGGLGYGWMSLLFVLGLIAGGLLVKLSPFLAVSFPKRDVTVGDLAKDLLAVNYARVVADVGSSNKKDVWEALCSVIVIQTGVPREKIVPQARIVRDLGIE